MNARVMRLKGTVDKVDDGIENYRANVAPSLKQQQGYAGARLLVDRDTGVSVSFTFWRDEAAAQASFEAMQSVRAEASSRFGDSQPNTKLFETAVQHRDKPTEAGHWVRLTTLNGDAAKVDDGVRHFESQVIPELAKLAGFRAAILFVDRASGEAIAATVWDSKADLDSSTGPAGPIRTSASEAMGAGEPQVESFEVAFAELLAPVSS